MREGAVVRACVGRAGAVAANGLHAASADDIDVVLVRTSQGLRAFQGRCPHQGALLAEGELDGDTLVCRNHGWRFNAGDGRREGGSERLACYPVIEEGGQVFVDVTGLDAAPKARARRRVEDLPGPRGLPIVGNLFQLDLSRLHEVLERWVAQYGPLYRHRLGPTTIVVVADPVLADQVLRARPDTYRRIANVAPVLREIGAAGVFSAEGAAWRAQRRLAMEALSPRHLGGFYPRLRSVAERLLGRWEGHAAGDCPVDIVDDLKRFTVDITTLLTFGRDVNTIEQGDNVIQRRLEHVFPAVNRRLFALIPTWRLVRGPADRRLDRALAEIRRWLDDLVREARARLAADPSRGERPSDFLEAMLVAKDDRGRPFEDEVIYGNLMTMLLAGEDTTAYTLGWAVHELCGSPASVAALRGELGATASAARVPADLESAQRLSYAGAIANETMRLRPVAPLLYLQANTATTLGDLELDAGTVVAILTRPPAVDGRHFERPRQFAPERWLAPPPIHEPSAHMPFGSGPRLCPGRTLALLEMKVVLATLYRNFDVERADADAVQEHFAFTMSPVGLRVRLRRIHSESSQLKLTVHSSQ